MAKDNIGMRMSEGEQPSSDENDMEIERMNAKSGQSKVGESLGHQYNYSREDSEDKQNGGSGSNLNRENN